MVWFSCTVTTNVAVDMQMRTWLQLAIVVLTVCLIVVMGFITIICMEICQRRKEERRVPPVIVIEESPMPTRTQPAPKSTPRPALRAGKTRTSTHRRRSTLWYSSHVQHHCAYAAALKAAGKRITKRAISSLKCLTSHEVREAFLRDEKIGHISVRDIVGERGCSLQEYVSQVQCLQWASIVEVHYMSKVLGITLLYDDEETRAYVGQGKVKG